MNESIIKLRQLENLELSILNKEMHMNYRNYSKMIKSIYDYAKRILDDVLGQDYTLPINIKEVANKLGFVVSVEDFESIRTTCFENGYDCAPIAQLTMREKQFGRDNDKICGTIHIADYLSEKSTRFYIAQQLGHFILREQSRVGSYIKIDADAGLYPLSNTNEMLTSVFGYALLLPYHLFEKTRIDYERYRTHWPLDYSHFVSFLSDKALMPEYYVVLATQELNRVDISLKNKKAEDKLYKKMQDLLILDVDKQQVFLKFYALIVNNLELWGFPQKQIANLLFEENVEDSETNNIKSINENIIEYLHDFYIQNDINAELLRNDCPQELIMQVVKCLYEKFDLSSYAISKIIGSPSDGIIKKLEVK